MWRVAFVALFALNSIAVLNASARADPVVLTSNDGYTSFEGDLIRLDNDFYVVSTSVGEVRIPVSGVQCKGAGCPAPVPAGNQNQVDQLPPENTTDDQNALFQEFLEWRKRNAN